MILLLSKQPCNYFHKILKHAYTGMLENSFPFNLKKMSDI